MLGEGSGLTQAATGQNSIADNLDGRFFANTLGYMAKIFALANGDYSYEQAMMEHGNLPPDPYSNGPYTNRLIGPANRIDAVYKRKGGLDFKMPLEVKFHYVARPIGGVNPKAALLDILSNFLVMCSASAMFWGGANRFMLNPQTYPFFAKNGQSLLQKLYRGEVFGENGAIDLIKEAATSANNMGSLSDFVSGILGAIGGAAALIGKSIIKSEIIAYEDLGAEAIRKIEVKDMPLVVIIDSNGNNLYETGKAEYLKMKEEKNV